MLVLVILLLCSNRSIVSKTNELLRIVIPSKNLAIKNALFRTDVFQNVPSHSRIQTQHRRWLI